MLFAGVGYEIYYFARLLSLDTLTGIHHQFKLSGKKQDK